MSKFEDMRKALTTPMGGILTDVKKVFPNKDYTPDPNTPYMKYFVLRNTPSASSLGANGQDEHTGTFQVSVFYPKSTGDLTLLAAADEIEQTYQQYVRGAYLSVGVANVKITSVGLGSASADDTHFFIPVNINYRSHIKGVL